MSAFALHKMESLSGHHDQLVNYLRSQVLFGPLKTVEFVSEAVKILGISRSDALALSEELDFEDGKLFNVAILFEVTKVEKPMRPLYMDAVIAAITSDRAKNNNNKNVYVTGSTSTRANDTQSYVAVKNVVDAMVADLYKVCHGGYALDSTIFIDVAVRHDLRRSEAWRLLKEMNFEEGLCVSASSKWFTDEGKMRELYWYTLADAHIQSSLPGRIHIMATGEVEELSPKHDSNKIPSWARRGLLQKSYKTVNGNTCRNRNRNYYKPMSSGSPRKQLSPSSEAPTPTGLLKSLSFRSADRKHMSSSDSGGEEYDAESSDRSDVEEEEQQQQQEVHSEQKQQRTSRSTSPSTSPDNRKIRTPDWASSHKWKKRISFTYGLGGDM